MQKESIMQKAISLEFKYTSKEPAYIGEKSYNVVSFELLIRKGTTVEIDWGDSSSDKYVEDGRNVGFNYSNDAYWDYNHGKKWANFWHEYGDGLSNHTINISQDSPAAIFGLKVDNYDSPKCSKLDVSMCSSLRKLEVPGSSFRLLDLSHNPTIQTVNVSNSRLCTIILRNCVSLELIDSRACHSLRCLDIDKYDYPNLMIYCKGTKLSKDFLSNFPLHDFFYDF